MWVGMSFGMGVDTRGGKDLVELECEQAEECAEHDDDRSVAFIVCELLWLQGLVLCSVSLAYVFGGVCVG